MMREAPDEACVGQMKGVMTKEKDGAYRQGQDRQKTS